MNILLWVDPDNLSILHNIVITLEHGGENTFDHHTFSVYYHSTPGHVQISLPVSTYFQLIDLSNVTYIKNA